MIIDSMILDSQNSKKYLPILVDYCRKILKNHLLSLKFLTELNNHTLSFTTSFDMHLLKHGLSSDLEEMALKKFNDKRIEEFLHFSQLLDMLNFKLGNLMNLSIEFWNMFMQVDAMDLSQLITDTMNVITCKENIDKIWQKLTPYFKSDRKLNALYRVYRVEFKNENIDISQDSGRNDEEDAFAVDTNQNVFGPNYHRFFFHKLSCVIDLNMSGIKIGTINQVTSNVLQLFSYDKFDLEGQSINKLIPKSVMDAHTNILDSVATAGKLKRKDQIIRVYAVDKDNRPVSIKLYYKPYATSQASLSMISFVVPHIEELFRMKFFVMTDGGGFIQTFSKNLETLFSITQYDYRNKDINIGLFAYTFLESLSLFNSRLEEKVDTFSALTAVFIA